LISLNIRLIFRVGWYPIWSNQFQIQKC